MKSKASYIYGRHPVAEMLRQRPRDLHRLFVADAARSTRLSDLVRTAERLGIPVVGLGRRGLGDLVGNVPHQGVVASIAPFAYVDVAESLDLARQKNEAPLMVALDHIQDPQNLGSLIRSAFALGAHGVVVPKDRACEITPSVVKASAGASAHLNISRVVNLRRSLTELQSAGLWLIGVDMAGEQRLDELDLIQPAVLVIGSEGKGLRPTVRRLCDGVANIPMGGDLGSLNAAVAGSIALYEASRQRREAS